MVRFGDYYDSWRNPIMSLRINQNIMALKSHDSVVESSARLAKSIERLSSGLRIRSADDDPAGLALSERLRRQIRGISRAMSNAQDGMSMVQTAEGALNESHSILQRMRELSVQSLSDGLGGTDRLEIQKEVDQLRKELNRIASGTEFNSKRLLNGSQTAFLSSDSPSVKGFAMGDIVGSRTYNVDIQLLRGGASQLQQSRIFTVSGSGENATGNTQLQSIAQFYDSEGEFILDTPQLLTLHGNSRTASVSIQGQMTMDELASELQNAVSSSSGLDLKSSSVKAIHSDHPLATNQGSYITMESSVPGNRGDISIASSHEVMGALGMDVLRESADSWVRITADDGFGNKRQISTQSDRVHGLIPGIELELTTHAAHITGIKGLEMGLHLENNAQFIVEAGEDNRHITVVGGNWTMEGIARNINDQLDGQIDGLEASVVDGEIRLIYSKPPGLPDTVTNAIILSNVNSEAQVIGFIDGESAGFVEGQKDQSRNRLGFSTYVEGVGNNDDLVFIVNDGANEFDFVVETENSIDRPDMILFADFQADFNTQALGEEVAARVDDVSGAISFTSTRFGTEKLDSSTSINSFLTLRLTNSPEEILAVMQPRLGFSEYTSSRGSGDMSFVFQVVDNRAQVQSGPNEGQIMQFDMSDMSTQALEIDKVDLTTQRSAKKSMAIIDKAIDRVSSERAKLGAYSNRLSSTVNNLRSTHSNIVAAESRIRDADIAIEMIEFTRNQIISQSGYAMLAQANMVPQSILDLLKNNQ